MRCGNRSKKKITDVKAVNTYSALALVYDMVMDHVDYDGWADLEDFFHDDESQWADADGDGYGDQLTGFQGDSCPSVVGTSMNDRFGCIDSDNDGWSDHGDSLPPNPSPSWSSHCVASSVNASACLPVGLSP